MDKKGFVNLSGKTNWKYIVIVMFFTVLVGGGVIFFVSRYVELPEISLPNLGNNPITFQVFSNQQECEEKTGCECSFVMCDYVPPGKTFEEVCGKDFKKGWQCKKPVAPITSVTPLPVSPSVPTLRILSPKDGETITLPAEIRYQVIGFEVGTAPLGHMHAFVGDPATSQQLVIPLAGQADVAYLPDDKFAFLAGQRDLTFQLANADHTLVRNPEAQVTVRSLLIKGRK